MEPSELRCRQCKALLGIEDDGRLTIQRGGMQATILQPSTVVIVCYRCGQLNVFALAAGRKPSDGN